MPAQILLTNGQLEAMATIGHDVIVLEVAAGADAIDCWVMDEETLHTDTHRSLIIDASGHILGDAQVDD